MVKKTTRDKWKTKKWYTVLAPKMFGDIKIGETVADDPSRLIGRRVEMTLRDLTGDIKNQNLKLILEICDVDHHAARTKLIGHEMDGDYLRSLVRRRSLRVDSNIDVTTKDGYDVRMKTLCFTLKKAQKLQVGMIRQVAEETIRDRARNLEFNNYVQEIILGKLASDIYKNAKKIYPLRRVEINKMEIIK